MDCGIAGIPLPCLDTNTMLTNLILGFFHLIFPVRKNEYPKDQKDFLKNNEQFDFIIIGAGSAGSVVASRLAENGIYKVLLLEAGTYPSALVDIPVASFSVQTTEEDWNYRTAPSDTSCKGLNNGQCFWPRGKVLGGTSSLNAMLYLRGNKADYDNWEKLGNEKWSYEDVLPFFKKSEQVVIDQETAFYGKDGALTLTKIISQEPTRKVIIESAKELGYDYHDTEPNIGYFDALSNIDKGIRANAAWKFLGKNKHLDNLIMSTKSHVKKILIDSSTKQAKGVEVLVDGTTKTFYATKEIVLSGGTINSPQLLMLSGIGPKEHLKSHGIEPIVDLQGVGRNLQDHMAMTGVFVKLNEKVDEIDRSGPFYDIYEYYRYRSGNLANLRTINFLGMINTVNKSSTLANFQILHPFFFKNDPSFSYFLQKNNYNDRSIKALQKAVEKNSILLLYSSLLTPKSRGQILLNSNDPLDHPIIQSGYLTDKNGEDMDSFLSAIKYCKELLSTKALREVEAELVDPDLWNCKNFTFDTEDYWKCAIASLGSTTYHPSGTCKMGKKDDLSAVVDQRLRVYGVKNLRVIDASIIPVIPRANTNSVAMMIGQKGAEMILEDQAESSNNGEKLSKEKVARHGEL